MQRLLVIGAGFAGMYAALAAARLRELQGVSPGELEITVISPQPALVIRPRLYEPAPETMAAPLAELFEATDIRFVRGTVETIDSAGGAVGVVGPDGERGRLAYDRLVLAAGSRLFKPDIPGLAEHSFSAYQIEDAVTLDRHIQALADRPRSAARDTVVVAGGGFTGIEVATEMPSRLRAILGEDADIRVIIVDRSDAIAPDMGPDPRPVIEHALLEAGVTTRLGVGVAALDGTGVTLSDGERIESATVIWAAGLRASPLTAQIPAERDRLGRLLVDRDLRVPGVPHVFATGDTACAASDEVGNHALMSCQHAIPLGSFAGRNAAADLLGVPAEPYHQEVYVTCLDLGPWGGVFTRGWDRRVELTGAKAKALKREINTVWIYPPQADRALALAAAEKVRVIDY